MPLEKARDLVFENLEDIKKIASQHLGVKGMINECLVSEVRPRSVSQLKLLKEPVLIVIKHILAKPQKRKL